MTIDLLNRELYGSAEAARLLGVHPRTMTNWLEGYERRGTRYPPVLRPEPTGSDLLTWGEFVEAGLLAEYRRNRDVPLQHIRPVVSALRTRYGVPYPLAHFQPYVVDRELVVEIEEAEGVPSSARFVVVRNGQLLLSEPAEAFFHKIEFSDDVVRLLYPAGRAGKVVIDPARNFGLPEVSGVRTEILVELFRAGESIEMLTTAYELDFASVEAAIRYESSRQTSAEAAAA